MLNERTIINGEERDLNKEEQKGVADFHNSRVAFAIIGDKNNYQLAINVHDPREHRVYLKEDFGIDDEKFETLMRGYIKEGKINFYITSYFEKIDFNEISEEMLSDLLNLAKKEFSPGVYTIGNGLVVGVPGGPEWPPREIIGKWEIDSEGTIKKVS